MNDVKVMILPLDSNEHSDISFRELMIKQTNDFINDGYKWLNEYTIFDVQENKHKQIVTMGKYEA